MIKTTSRIPRILGGLIVRLASGGAGDADVRGKEAAKEVILGHAGQDVTDTLEEVVPCLKSVVLGHLC